MNTIRIHARLDSTTLTLPELAPLLGKRVEIVVSAAAGDSAIESLRSSPFSAAAEILEEEFGAPSRLA